MDNSNNKKWWDDHTMSYKDWDLDEKHRSKESHEAIIEVNQKYISSNPFLEYFWELIYMANNHLDEDYVDYISF